MSNLIQSSPLLTFMNLNVYFLLMVYFQPYPIKPTVDLYEPFWVLSSLCIFPTLSNQAHCWPLWSFLCSFILSQPNLAQGKTWSWILNEWIFVEVWLPPCFSNSEFIWVWKGPVEMHEGWGKYFGASVWDGGCLVARDINESGISLTILLLWRVQLK